MGWLLTEEILSLQAGRQIPTEIRSVNFGAASSSPVLLGILVISQRLAPLRDCTLVPGMLLPLSCLPIQPTLPASVLRKQPLLAA